MPTSIEPGSERFDPTKPFSNAELENAMKLSRDLQEAAQNMGSDQTRFAVDNYYRIQQMRLALAAQGRELQASGEPHAVIDHFHKFMHTLEEQAAKALERSLKYRQAAQWALGQKGLGGVLIAALVSHIDMEESVTSGHLISYAGLHPDVRWEKGQLRPYNADLKTLLAYKIGESFVKFQGLDDAFYPDLFTQFKAEEIRRNDTGHYEESARKVATQEFRNRKGVTRIGKYDTTTDAWAWVNGCFPAGFTHTLADIPNQVPSEILEIPDARERTKRKKDWAKQYRLELLTSHRMQPGQGLPMLPPGQLHARARRRAVKIFAVHFWEELFVEHYNKQPPEPYVFSHLDHAHKIERPNPSQPDPDRPALDHPTIPWSRRPENAAEVKKRQRRRQRKAAAYEEKMDDLFVEGGFELDE